MINGFATFLGAASLLIHLSAAPAVAENSRNPGPDTDVFDLSLEELKDLTITVTSKTEETLSQSPGIVSVIDFSELRAMGIRTLKDALSLIVNVKATEGTFGTTNIEIRGITDEWNHTLLVLIDSVPYWMSSHGDFPINAVPVDVAVVPLVTKYATPVVLFEPDVVAVVDASVLSGMYTSSEPRFVTRRVTLNSPNALAAVSPPLV